MFSVPSVIKLNLTGEAPGRHVEISGAALAR
jgi:hypothetical protein